MELMLILTFVWLCFAFFGTYVAGQKGRPGVEGFLLGFLFGPLGVLVVAILPTIGRRPAVSRHRPRSAWAPGPEDRWPGDPIPGNPDEDAAYRFLTGISSDAPKSEAHRFLRDLEGRQPER